MVERKTEDWRDGGGVNGAEEVITMIDEWNELAFSVVGKGGETEREGGEVRSWTWVGMKVRTVSTEKFRRSPVLVEVVGANRVGVNVAVMKE